MNVAAWRSSMVNTVNVSKLSSYVKVGKTKIAFKGLYVSNQFRLVLASFSLSYQRDITKHFT